jgi:hypothetical protein
MKINLLAKRALFSLFAFVLLGLSSALAQSTTDNSNSNDKSADASAQKPADSSSKDKSSATKDTVPASTDPASNDPWYSNTNGAYTVSLGTGQLISLYPQPRNDQTLPSGEYVEGEQAVSLKSRDYKYQLLYGLSASSVYTNSLGTVGAPSDVVSTSINPYLAAFMPTRTGRYLLQYSSVINPNDTASGGPQAYHTVTLSAMGSLNDRWYWTAESSGSYGSESARLQGPLSFLVVDSTPVADTSSAAVLLRARNVAFSESTFGLGWIKSRRDKISFAVSHIYTGIEGDPTTVGSSGSHSNALEGKFDYAHAMTQRVDLVTYAEADTVLTGPVCNTYGGGLGLSVRATQTVTFNVRGGPQGTTASCGAPLSANFRADAVKNFAHDSRIYAAVTRQFTTVPGLNSRWEDDATVGFSKGIQRLTFITDAGYLRGAAVSLALPGYHGYYVAPRIRYKIINSMGFTAGYRSFHGVGGDIVSGNLSYATAGIEWYPAPLHFR